jgi:germination protein, Ger(x)C family
MMPRIRKLLLTAAAAIFIAMMLSGCWDIVDPQDINYFMAVGFDYVDDQFIIYAQMIDFAAVTTPESDKPTQHQPVLVGKGKGETAAQAFNDLYDSVQRRVIYGHVGAVILSENIMKHGLLQDIFDLLSRYQELRYTPWVYGSKGDIEKVLSVSPFFNLSPLASILHQPMEIYRQKSIVPPTMMRQILTDIREPGRTAILPAIDLNDTDWKEDLGPKEMLYLTGIFTFDAYRYTGYFSLDEIQGLRFVAKGIERTPLVIKHEGKIYSEISLNKPKAKITPLLEDVRVRFQMQVAMTGNVIEVIEPINEREMEKLASEQIRKEIISTYERALEKNVDIYQLEHLVYLKHNKWWQQHLKGGKLRLDKDSLEVDVKIDILSSGKLKLITE